MTKLQLIQKHLNNKETPKWLYDKLNKEFDFNLDPCPIKPSFDGLKIRWYGNVYVNPPYNNIPTWLEKAKRELPNCNTIVFLLPVDTSTKWFHNYIVNKGRIRFIKGRLKFDKKPAPFASMIIIFRK